MSAVKDSEMAKCTTHNGSKTWEYLAIATSAIFAFSIGTTIGWISPTIIKLMEPDSPVPFTPEDISTMVAVGSVGSLVAPIVSTAIVDRLGRRNTLLIGGLPAVLSSALTMIARDVWVIHVARVLAGFSLGVGICVSPIYVGEIASPKTRGAAGSVLGVMINLGILFAYGICPYLSIAVVAGILMSISVVFEVSFWFMPESPHYLAMIGRFDEAQSTLGLLRGKADVGDEVETIMELIPKQDKTNLKPTKRKSGSVKDVFAISANRRAFAIAFTFLIPQFFGGYMAVLVYGDLIFRDAGSAIPTHLATIAVGVVQLISAILAGLLVDRLGRKPLILGSGVVAGFANLAVAVYFYAKEYTSYDVTQYAGLFLVAVLVQIFAFNCGLLSTHMVLMSEIFAPEVKGISMCLVGVFSAVFSAVVSKLYIAVAITWGFGHSLSFFASVIIVWVFTVVLVRITPETKGKTFLQIQQKFNR